MEGQAERHVRLIAIASHRSTQPEHIDFICFIFQVIFIWDLVNLIGPCNDFPASMKLQLWVMGY